MKYIARFLLAFLLAVGASAEAKQHGAGNQYGTLRAASPTNWMPTGANLVTQGTAYGYHSKWLHYIAWDTTECHVVEQNFQIGGSSVLLPGNQKKINAAYLIEVATGTAVPVTWSGSSTLTMADGATNQVSDPILPSSFGKEKLSRGAGYVISEVGETVSGGKLVSHNFNAPSGNNSYGLIFPPASTTITNASQLGAPTFTGTAPTYGRASTGILVCKPPSPETPTYGGAGDSILEGVGDRNGTAIQAGLYSGFFSRSLWTVTGDPTQPIRGGINYGVSGGVIDVWRVGASFANYLAAYVQYTTVWLDEYGTNSYTTTNTGNVNFYAQTQERGFWSALRNYSISGVIKIIRTKLMPRTSGGPFTASSAADGSDQTVYGPPWDVINGTTSGDVDRVNNSFAADEGVAGRIDKFISWDDIVRINQDIATTQYHKSIPGTLGDGVHPTPAFAETMAARLRAYYLTIE